MPVYNKLVRDRIPEIIEKTGKTFTARTLNEKGYIEAVCKKYRPFCSFTVKVPLSQIKLTQFK